MTEIPDEVRRLAAERAGRRDAKDYAAADRIRDRLAELGFRVVDAAGGPSIEPLEREAEPRRLDADAVPSVLEEPSTADVSVGWVVEGWPEDVARAIAAFRSTAGDRTVHYVVADVTGSDPAFFGESVEVLKLSPGTGWAAARNAGLRRSRGRIVLAMDGSIEPIGDVLGPIERELADDAVGVCGPFGIVSEDLRSFEASPGVG
jgi:Glycosyl transferase family 2